MNKAVVVWQGFYMGREHRLVKNGRLITTERLRRDALGQAAWVRAKNQEYAPFFLHVITDLTGLQKGCALPEDVRRWREIVDSLDPLMWPCK